MRRVLARLARRAPARVFVVEGASPPAPPELLRLDDRVHLVESPRSATILLRAGVIPEALAAAVDQLHDQMASPRCTASWRETGPAVGDARDPPPGRSVAGSVAEVAARLAALQADLVSGVVPSEPARLPDVEPAEWRGVGPYGQGGTGMTGGVPYGRPMAETASDRDGLKLDRLDVRVGPYFPPFPPGLVLALGLQGDVIQEVSVDANPFAGLERTVCPDDLFRRALDQPVPIADVELARARHHLRRLAHALRVHGLDALGRRALHVAATLAPGAVESLTALAHRLERTRALAIATGGVGVLTPDDARDQGLGPVARASGLAEDSRGDEEAYRRLGFEPLAQGAGDARARWRQRLAEARQSVTLAGRAGDAVTGGRGQVESPRGRLTRTASPLAALLALVPRLLPGLEWGDAVTTVVSLDIDLRDVPPRPGHATGEDAPRP